MLWPDFWRCSILFFLDVYLHFSMGGQSLAAPSHFSGRSCGLTEAPGLGVLWFDLRLVWKPALESREAAWPWPMGEVGVSSRSSKRGAGRMGRVSDKKGWIATQLFLLLLDVPVIYLIPGRKIRIFKQKYFCVFFWLVCHFSCQWWTRSGPVQEKASMSSFFPCHFTAVASYPLHFLPLLLPFSTFSSPHAALCIPSHLFAPGAVGADGRVPGCCGSREHSLPKHLSLSESMSSGTPHSRELRSAFAVKCVHKAGMSLLRFLIELLISKVILRQNLIILKLFFLRDNPFKKPEIAPHCVDPHKLFESPGPKLLWEMALDQWKKTFSNVHFIQAFKLFFVVVVVLVLFSNKRNKAIISDHGLGSLLKQQ